MEENRWILTMDHVSFRYPQTGEENESRDADTVPPAVSNVSFALEAGSFCAVIGHNGSGKSTLAKLINAMLLPQEGKVTVDGMDTADESMLWEIRRRAGMVFQNPDNQLVASVVEEDVAFGPENLGVPREELRQRVDDALNAVGMSEYAERSPHMLSGGQKQRVAIAGVLAMRPKLLVLDESTAMLDPRGRQEVLETVRRLNRNDGITVLLITHFMEEAIHADRVLVMDHGHLAADGTPVEIFRKTEELTALGLEVPPMVELAAGLREDGFDIPDSVMDTEGMVETLCRLLSKK